MTARARHAGEVLAPPLAPSDEALDLAHLKRMTLDDRSLEREVLVLFDRQAEVLIDRIAGGEHGAILAAHTLKGSARNIGAWRVALAAEAVERAEAATRADAIQALTAAIAEARHAIARRLQAC